MASYAGVGIASTVIDAVIQFSPWYKKCEMFVKKRQLAGDDTSRLNKVTRSTSKESYKEYINVDALLIDRYAKGNKSTKCLSEYPAVFFARKLYECLIFMRSDFGRFLT
ncbi:hypothetical protein RF11_07643 [Thelohanellus kitauei]|uniref:Uncharacterized protein n=1 Tax=Thelohanellus kitauei TaxID=669202 RepID=A0A0C2N0A6_THEKT|nr:hypothetical protein RF11_07643 [Thelohanellus kitauei]